MFRFAIWFASACAGVAAATLAVLFGVVIATSPLAAVGGGNETASARAPVTTVSVNRAAKGDKLAAAVAGAQEQKRIVTVEVVGLRDAAVVYRDREGRVLFQTDPVANMTVVAKNVVLPEVTIRDSRQSSVGRLPIDSARPVTPAGCEPALSRDLAPTLAHISGSCLAHFGKQPTLAALQ